MSAELNQIEDARIHHHPQASQIKSSDAMRLQFQRELWNKLPLSDRRFELYDLLEAHHDAECTDIRDRIFGLLSLTYMPDMRPAFPADYSMSVVELYFQALRYFENRLSFPVSCRSNGSSPTVRKYTILLLQTLKLDHREDLIVQETNRLPLSNAIDDSLRPPQALVVANSASTNKDRDVIQTSACSSYHEWKEISDHAERRRIQNRIVQRNYRKSTRIF
jgi:hypothetical protein